MNQHSMNGRHGLIMLLCCLIPLGALLLVSVVGISIGSLGSAALVLLCPLLHIFMMRTMMGHGTGRSVPAQKVEGATPKLES